MLFFILTPFLIVLLLIYVCLPRAFCLMYSLYSLAFVVLHNKRKTKFILTLTLFYIKYEKNKEKRIQ